MNMLSCCVWLWLSSKFLLMMNSVILYEKYDFAVMLCLTLAFLQVSMNDEFSDALWKVWLCCHVVFDSGFPQSANEWWIQWYFMEKYDFAVMLCLTLAYGKVLMNDHDEDCQRHAVMGTPAWHQHSWLAFVHHLIVFINRTDRKCFNCLCLIVISVLPKVCQSASDPGFRQTCCAR